MQILEHVDISYKLICLRFTVAILESGRSSRCLKLPRAVLAISAPSARMMHAYGSLIKNLLRTFFKFTSSFVVQLLLFGHRGCAVLRLSSCWRLSRWGIAYLRLLLPICGIVGLLCHATLVKSLLVVILVSG